MTKELREIRWDPVDKEGIPRIEADANNMLHNCL